MRVNVPPDSDAHPPDASPDAHHSVRPDADPGIRTRDVDAVYDTPDTATPRPHSAYSPYSRLWAGPWWPRASLRRSFEHAWSGLQYAVRTQRNLRIHLVAAVCALALGGLLRLSAMEFALVLLAIVIVLASELFNTVVEAIVDLEANEYRELARVAKDVAAGAVLLCALFAVAIGLLVFVPHLWLLLGGSGQAAR